MMAASTTGTRGGMTVVSALGLLVLFAPVAVRASDEAPGNVIADRQILLDAFRNEGAGAVGQLTAALDDERALVNRTAAHLLAWLGEPALPGIEKALAHPDYRVRHVAIDAIVKLDRLDDHLAAIIADENPSIRRRFRLRLLPENLLAEDGTAPAGLIGKLEQVYRDGTPAVRRFVIDMAAELPPTAPTLKLLERAARDEDKDIRATAFRAVIEPRLARMQELARGRDRVQLVEEFKDADFGAWPDNLGYEGLYLLAETHRVLRQGPEAEAAFEKAVAISPDRRALLGMARNYRDNLEDQPRALAAYERALETSVGSTGHLLYSTILECTALLRAMDRRPEALAFLERNWPDHDFDERSGTWPYSFLTARALTLAALERRAEAIEYYRRALRVPRISERQKESAEQAIARLEGAEEGAEE